MGEGGSSTFILLSLLLLAVLPVTTAFTPIYTSPVTQCGTFNVQWSTTASDIQTGPPFTLTLVPIQTSPSSLPRVLSIPDSAWDPVAGQGSFTIDEFTMESGTEFIAVMDDGFGLGRGGVSAIQAVSPSQNNACLTSESSLPPNSAILLGSPTANQCKDLQIFSLTKPNSIRGFIPGGTAFSIDLANTDSTTTAVGTAAVFRTDWNVNVASGTSFILLLQGDGNIVSSTNLLTTEAGESESCLQASILPSSTRIVAAVTDPASSTSSAAPSASPSGGGGGGGSNNNTKMAAFIAGGIVGGLGLVALVAIGIFFLVLRKTNVDIFGPTNTSTTLNGTYQSQPRKKNGMFGMKAWPGLSVASTQNRSGGMVSTYTTEDTRGATSTLDMERAGGGDPSSPRSGGYWRAKVGRRPSDADSDFPSERQARAGRIRTNSSGRPLLDGTATRFGSGDDDIRSEISASKNRRGDRDRDDADSITVLDGRSVSHPPSIISGYSGRARNTSIRLADSNPDRKSADDEQVAEERRPAASSHPYANALSPHFERSEDEESTGYKSDVYDDPLRRAPR